jgi:hypothetical protein
MTEVMNIWEKNIAMWESMTANYTDTMFKAMEKAMVQSTTVQKQVNEAVATATSAQFEATLNAIKAVEQQVEALSTKVEDLIQTND